MKTKLILFLLFLNTYFIFCQNGLTKEYISYIKIADSLYEIKDYKNSAICYSNAFKSMGWKGTLDDRYSSICSWSLANEIDSAFANINILIDKFEYSNLSHFKTDEDLLNLHSDYRWNLSVKRIEDIKIKMEINYNYTLISLIDSLYVEDQRWRNILTKFNNHEIVDSLITKQIISKNISLTDSLNYFQVRDIIKKYGYPNYDIVGTERTNKFWYLIQHQDKLPAFQDSILILMKIEVDREKASPANYAYLIDRVKVNTGQLQIYGTQMILNSNSTSYEPKPVIDIEKLDERRKSVGLPPVEEYIKIMNSRYFGTLK